MNAHNTLRKWVPMLLLTSMVLIYPYVSTHGQETTAEVKTQDSDQKFYPTNINKKNIAIDGYDVVAYFEDGKPTKGSSKFSYEWMGATWHFSSEAHKTLFAETPSYYAPQYGGFCAYAVASGYTAKIDPKAWTIYEDKLYLNYSKSIRSQWEKDKDTYIIKADKNWVTIE